MPQELLPDLFAGIIVAAAFLIGVWIAYHRGFRAALPVRHGEFDFLATTVSLHGSRWRLCSMPAGVPTDAAELPTAFQLEQAGSRIVGAGRHADGSAWRLEGVVQQRKVICITCGLESNPHEPGLLMLRVAPDSQHLEGYSITWNGQGSSLALREISFARSTHDKDAVDEPRVNAITQAT